MTKPNPDPARITAAMWRLWTEFDRHHPEVQLGGIYARKPGYHSTRNDNRNNWPGDYSISFAADRLGPADKSAAIDLTFPEAHGGDYTNMRKYTARLDAAARAEDPRLYVAGTPVLREFIGTLDGRRTYAYDLQRRRGDNDRDSSHMWHIHLSVTRQFVADWDVLSGVLSVLIGDADMPTEKEIAKAVWGFDPNADKAGGVYNIPGRGDSDTNITVTPAWALREGWREARDGTAETRTLRREQAAANAAILAAVKGEDVVGAVERALDEAAVRERAERAVERQQLATDLAPGLADALHAAVGEGLGADAARQIVEDAVRNVFGSLDEGAPTG